ncbi:unnamed protein product [Mycena citricolor]|uniref:Uncharacterized protein n=1 Tax=Mycena citricolor TaxID=2018698 RepID=A0AAD2HI10_9AGAR|nr:unnamed protein product [Mycena citricolor]
MSMVVVRVVIRVAMMMVRMPVRGGCGRWCGGGRLGFHTRHVCHSRQTRLNRTRLKAHDSFPMRQDLLLLHKQIPIEDLEELSLNPTDVSLPKDTRAQRPVHITQSAVLRELARDNERAQEYALQSPIFDCDGKVRTRSGDIYQGNEYGSRCDFGAGEHRANELGKLRLVRGQLGGALRMVVLVWRVTGQSEADGIRYAFDDVCYHRRGELDIQKLQDRRRVVGRIYKRGGMYGRVRAQAGCGSRCGGPRRVVGHRGHDATGNGRGRRVIGVRFPFFEILVIKP